MKFDTFSYTNTGGCFPNEDAFCYCGDDLHNLWVICDGLGGHLDGEKASNLAVNTMLDHFTSESLKEHSDLGMVIDDTNKKICSLGGPLTTIVAAYYKNSLFSIANVGDSRLYFFRKRQISFITADHSVAYADYCMKKTNYTDLRFHPERSSLMKALGVQETSGVQCYPPFQVYPGDVFLLCSDGFWEYVFETEMEIDLIKSKTPKQWIDYMLVRAAERIPQDNDNMTAIAVFIQNDNQEKI